MPDILRYDVKTSQTGTHPVIKLYKQKHGEPPRQSTSSKQTKGGKNKKPKAKR